VLIKNLEKPNRLGTPSPATLTLARHMREDPRPATVQEFLERMSVLNVAAQDKVQAAVEWGAHVDGSHASHGAAAEDADRGNERPTHHDQTKRDSKGKGNGTERGNARPASADDSKLPRCYGCGHSGKKRSECMLCPGHPDRNEENVKFWDSAAGLALRKRKVKPVQLELDKRADGKPLSEAQIKAMATARKAMKSGEYLCPMMEDRVSRALIPASIFVNSATYLDVHVLLDSGAPQANYVSPRIAKWLRDQQWEHAACPLSTEEKDWAGKVNLGGTGITSSTTGMVSFNLKFFNEVLQSHEIISCMKARVFPTDIDIVIGLPLIRERNLTVKISSHFNVSKEEGAPSDASAIAIVPKASGQCMCEHPDPPCSAREPSGDAPVQAVPCTCAADTLVRTHSDERVTTQFSAIADVKDKNELLDYEDDPDDVEWPDDPFEVSEDARKRTADELLAMITICGSPTLQKKIVAVCGEFVDIFSEAVRPEPARVPPMDLQVNMEKWQTNKHRLPPRPQTRTKMQEIEKQVKKYLDLKVIEPSTAAEYSQVHLVPKPTPNEWRFCLDFVELNDSTVGTEGWPIPNIPHMLSRIGDKKPKVFGVMDMTAGYHQAPISKSSRAFTAFTCFLGVYHWLRVPMGLKNAASFFQRVMATVVLINLMYIICELYIDDVLVFGKTDDEFASNLKTVFQRFRKHNITLNPKKCKFGMDHVEYVGRVISKDGVTFSDTKREKVLNFPLPTRLKELQGFLGLVNYFRDHVSNMSEKVRGIRTLVDNKSKSKKLAWTPELEAQYYQLQEEVATCPALFFIHEHAMIVVMTDASDYGIGAYIYQVVDGKELPIVFMSKTLHGAQLNWSVIEKEAYAIFITLTKFSHLLRDNHFLLRTDHKNLTYINVESSPKVKRWKIALQDFNFKIEHVAGKDNPVADAFSRLCVIWEPDMSDSDYVCHLVEEGSVSAPRQNNAVLLPVETRLPDEQYAHIAKVHNATVGHMGVNCTLDRLRKAKIVWPKMRKHISQFIRQCPSCQKLNERKLMQKTEPFTTAAYHPMEVLNIDTIGPVESDDNKNEHILVIIDCFTRWVELVAIPDTSALSAARGLLQHVGRFGIPGQIRSDRGTQFVNGIIEELTALMHSEQQIGTAYSKEENAIVERANKEVMRHLRAIIFDEKVQSNWAQDQLPLVARIMNSAEKVTTGVSPAELLFGNMIDLDREILRKPLIPIGERPDRKLSNYMETLLKQQAAIIEVARATQLQNDSHHMSEFDPQFTEYPINSYVLVDPPEGNRAKLAMKKKGPYQVVGIKKSIYKLRDLLSGREFSLHISNLAPFNFDSTRTDPKVVAMQDAHEYEIERILSHRGDRYKRKDMTFLVRWKGFSQEHDTWEPYQGLKDTVQLLSYIEQKGWKNLLPRSKKTP
jgi:transposase InsO family protein